MTDAEGVVFDVDGTQVILSRTSATVLGEKLHNYGAGQYQGDVADLASRGVEPSWLQGAGAAADAIEDVLTDTAAGPIPLDAHGKAADAVFAVLRLTGPVFFDAMSDVSQLHSALRDARS